MNMPNSFKKDDEFLTQMGHSAVAAFGFLGSPIRIRSSSKEWGCAVTSIPIRPSFFADFNHKI